MLVIRGFTVLFFFFQAEDGIRDLYVTGVQTCALPISRRRAGETPGPGAAVSGGTRGSGGRARLRQAGRGAVRAVRAPACRERLGRAGASRRASRRDRGGSEDPAPGDAPGDRGGSCAARRRRGPRRALLGRRQALEAA